MDRGARAFWERTPLAGMTPRQWELLCDGCARCCAQKLEDERSGRVHYTAVACPLLDIESCRCRAYAERATRMPGCACLTPSNIPRFTWLPASCAYRRLAEGKPLPAWHPLVTGDPESTHRAGMSMRGRLIPPADAGDLEDHLIPRL
jgi:uncharacterized cysteine cluster protein YcgN (CxxCxxCC family)